MGRFRLFKRLTITAYQLRFPLKFSWLVEVFFTAAYAFRKNLLQRSWVRLYSCQPRYKKIRCFAEVKRSYCIFVGTSFVLFQNNSRILFPPLQSIVYEDIFLSVSDELLKYWSKRVLFRLGKTVDFLLLLYSWERWNYLVFSITRSHKGVKSLRKLNFGAVCEFDWTYSCVDNLAVGRVVLVSETSGSFFIIWIWVRLAYR